MCRSGSRVAPQNKAETHKVFLYAEEFFKLGVGTRLTSGSALVFAFKKGKNT